MRTLAFSLACCALLAGCGGSTPTAPSPSPTLSHTRFLAFGDSLTSGEVTVPVTLVPPGPIGEVGPRSFAQVVVPSASYPTLLQSLLQARYTTQAAAITVINEGKVGEHAHEGAARFVETFTAAQPQVVLLWEGVNSLFLYGTDLPMQALTEMVADSKSRGAKVFLANMPPTRPGGRNSQSVLRLEEMNDRIKALAAAEGVVLVNIYDALKPDLESVIGVDGLHPTEAGYRRIADIFFSAIRAELEVR